MMGCNIRRRRRWWEVAWTHLHHGHAIGRGLEFRRRGCRGHPKRRGRCGHVRGQSSQSIAFAFACRSGRLRSMPSLAQIGVPRRRPSRLGPAGRCADDQAPDRTIAARERDAWQARRGIRDTVRAEMPCGPSGPPSGGPSSHPSGSPSGPPPGRPTGPPTRPPSFFDAVESICPGTTKQLA